MVMHRVTTGRRRPAIAIIACLLTCGVILVGVVLLAMKPAEDTTTLVCLSLVESENEVLVARMYGRLSLVSLNDGVVSLRFQTESEIVNDVAVADLEMVAVAGGSDGRVSLWDLRTGQCLSAWNAENEVTAIGISGDARFVIAGDRGGNVSLWDATTGHQEWRVAGHEAGGVSGIAIASGDELIASSGYDGVINVWEYSGGLINTMRLPWKEGSGGYFAETTKGSNRFSLEGGSVTCLAFSPDGRLIVSGESHGIVRIWDVDSGAVISRIDGWEPIRCIAVARDGGLIGVGTAHGHIRMIEMNGDELQGEYATVRYAAINDVSFTADSETLVFAAAHRLYRCDVDGRERARIVR